MRVILISTDKKVFNEKSAVSGRMREYGTLFGEMHLIVFSLKSHELSRKQIAPNVFLYPTNSSTKIGYVFGAIRIGKSILKNIYFGPTVVSAQDPFETGIVAVVLKWFKKIPIQIQIHTDPWSYAFRFAGLLNWFRVTVLAWITLPRADGVRTVSDKVRRDVIVRAKVLPKKVSVLPIFVDVDLVGKAPIVADLHSRYGETSVIVLMASRITREKNISLAIRAFRKIVKKYPAAMLVIVGEGPESAHLERLVRRYSLESRVHFEPWQNELVSYMRTTDVFLLTSDYEGYGMSIVEAGAAGKAVVSTWVGVAHDLLEDGRNALVCPVGNEQCLVTKLSTLFENPPLRKALGKELEQKIRQTSFSKAEYLQKFKTLFDALLP